MGIVVIGDVFIDIKGYALSPYIPQGRNAGTVIQIHGGVARNVAENIANIELKPTFISAVDDNAMGDDVIQKLKRHKVETKYMKKVKDGMGTWLAVFDHEGDVVASISKRPDHKPIEQILDEHGDEIFKDADSIAIEIDTDKEIEAAAGMAISDIFATQGEEAFRRLETGVLEKLLEQGGRSVISVGGGLPLREENRALLKQLGTVVYLDVLPETVMERIGSDVSDRPMLHGGDVMGRIVSLLESRKPHYLEASHIIVDVNGRDVDDIVEEIYRRAADKTC